MLRVRPNENDPRVIRTRQLIQEAFSSLTREKEIKDITIRNITERATINRATFYAHFEDKYDLMESIVEETFMTVVHQQLKSLEELTPETLKDLIIAVCRYHEKLSTNCKRTAQEVYPVVEMKIKDQLEQVISNWLSKEEVSPEAKKSLQWVAVMISQSIYGSAYLWNVRGRKISATVFADEILYILWPGLQAVMKKEV